MWLVTQHGFFNIVESDDDYERDQLTVKARRIEDLEEFRKRLGDETILIETSLINDYHFRLRAPKLEVVSTIGAMVNEINYNKTKPRLHRTHPDRSGIYFQVWEDLQGLQEG